MTAKTIPILPSASFDETSRFYGALGFTERGRWPREYLILERPDGIELHFWHQPNVDPKRNDVACYVRFDSEHEARALYEEWARVPLSAGARLEPPIAREYGLLELALVDPNGNLVRIGGRLGV
ncbi:MAG TPA: VOC family protein [Planctomycetota bacterium]|nr:VOC family protein [Planctomycetota bacterium]